MTIHAANAGVPGLPPLPTPSQPEWAMVTHLRRTVAERLTEELGRLGGSGSSWRWRRRMCGKRLGRSLIAAELADFVSGRVRAGLLAAPSVAEEDVLAEGVRRAVRARPVAAAD